MQILEDRKQMSEIAKTQRQSHQQQDDSFISQEALECSQSHNQDLAQSLYPQEDPLVVVNLGEQTKSQAAWI